MAYYRPGMEPEKLKKRMAMLFEKLNSAYPDKNVVGLHADHKKWGETVTELYRELGYPNGKSFLEAYGYKYGNKELGGGRPKSVDPEAIIKEFQKKYPNGSPFKSADELFAETEYESKLKTIKNCANDVFGMPLGKYLLLVGLIQSKAAHKAEKKKNYIICKVLPTAVKNPIYCIATSSRNNRVRIVFLMISIITFRLPVDSDADFTYANITHEGSFLQQSEVKTDASGNKYIEVSSNTFSVFGYELTNTRFVAPSTSSPVSTITRKSVVNTPAK